MIQKYLIKNFIGKWSSESLCEHVFFFYFGLVVFHDKSISDSQLSPVGVIHHNTASWTSSSWRLRVISTSAASTPMNEKGATATHLTLFLRFKVKGTGSLNSLVHHVDTRSQFVSACWQRAHIRFTLFIRIVISCALTAVAVSVDCVLSWPSSEPACLLVVIVGHMCASG